MLSLDLTVDLPGSEVEIAKINTHNWVPGAEDYVLLRGTDSRGWIELALRPREANVERLRQELIRHGARPT
jgi:hypothetical protein